MIKFKTSLLITCFLVLCGCERKSIENTATEKDTLSSMPVQNISDIKDSTFIINSETETILEFGSGTKIYIPKDAFIDDDGKLVKGSIKLIYNEYNNPLEIYLANIPMEYDSAGVKYTFETAGMFKMLAYKDDKALNVNPKNLIKVEKVSFNSSPKFNVYQLDTNSRTWNYVGKDLIKKEKYSAAIESLPKVPSPPKIAGESAFSVGDETGNLPELNEYNYVLFEPINGKSVSFRTFTKIEVQEAKDGLYKVTFTQEAFGKKKEESLLCYLAFKEGVEYNTAMKVYQKKYKSLIEKRNKQKRQIDEDWRKYLIEQERNEFFILTEEQKVLRALDVMKFGFINIDKAKISLEGYSAKSNIKEFIHELSPVYTNNGDKIELSNVVLVVKGRNALYNCTNTIVFDERDTTILWGMTKNGLLAYFKNEDFKKIKEKKGQYNFKMTVHPNKLSSYDEIYKLLFKD